MMKRRLLLFLLVSVPAIAQLRVPAIAYGTAAVSAQDSLVYDYPSIGAFPTFQQAEAVIFSPANLQDVIKTAATPFPNCVTTDGTTPTATTPGTCSNGTTYTYGASNTLNITGSVTVKAIATGVGQTNSSVATLVITVQPFYPAPGTFSYSPFLATLTGNMGSNLIYTTDGSTPTASGTCTATHGTAAANGTQVTLPSNATTTVKFIPCVGGVPGSMQTGAYTTRAKQVWYIRPDGGTRYDASTVPTGQCNGKFNVSYASTGGTGVNQNCAFNALRYMWDKNDRTGGIGVWIGAGGDDTIIYGCHALPGESNPSNPNCRVGWDANNGNPGMDWCYAVGSFTCTNPTIPSGSVSQPTRILGANYASCATGGQTNPRNYSTQLAQIFAGFGLTWSFDLRDTQNVTIGCIEFTTHNGACVTAGNPAYPRGCSTDPPDDFAGNGWYLNRNSKVTFQDVYTHGFSSSGMFGPFAGVTTTRVFVGFNASAGWQMDDGHTTPDGPLAYYIATYTTMGGNGCSEEYPLVHSFSAKACYDDASNGFGDSLSGQDTQLDTLVWDHGLNYLNTKDAFIGPHPLIKHLTITNSTAYGSSGSQWKFITDINSTLTFLNNLTIGNCNRMSVALPGAAHTFDLASALGGAYLSDYCRAGGNTMGSNMRAGNTWLMANNTFVGYTGYHLQISCGMAYWNNDGTCGSSVWNVTNNIFLGYTLSGIGVGPSVVLPTGGSDVVPILSHNIDFGNKPSSGVTCGSGGNLCSDPQLVSQPAQVGGGWTNATFLDGFNFNLTSGSPAIAGGATYGGSLSTDNAGNAQTSPLAIGGLVLAGDSPSPPTLVSMAITPNPGTVSTTLAMTCTATLSDSSTAACSSPAWTDTAAHSSVNSSTGVVTGVSAGSDTITATIGGVHATATVSVPAPAPATGIQATGTFDITGKQ